MEITSQDLLTASQIREKIQIVHAQRERFKCSIKQSMNIAIARSVPKIKANLTKLGLKKGTKLETKWEFDFVQNSTGNHDLLGCLVVLDENGQVLYRTLNHILFEKINLETTISSANWEFMKKKRANCKGIRFALRDIIEGDKAFDYVV